DLALLSIPAPRPVLVCPAETERKIECRILEQALDRTLEQTTAAEPVVVEAEAIDPVALGECGLLDIRVPEAKIVESQVAGQARLIMTSKNRPRSGDVSPLGKALAPPHVVLRHGVKLRQIKSNDARLVEGVDLCLVPNRE